MISRQGDWVSVMPGDAVMLHVSCMGIGSGWWEGCRRRVSVNAKGCLCNVAENIQVESRCHFRNIHHIRKKN